MMRQEIDSSNCTGNPSSDIEDVIEQIKASTMVEHAKYVKEYCECHKTCGKCLFFNGVCRLNNLPCNWDFYITK